MKKISIALLVFAFILSSCSAGKSALSEASPTETFLPTLENTPTPTATFTATPTITLTPTPSSTYKVFGINFGPYTEEGQNPDLGTVISQDQLTKQIELIAPYTQWIRTYGCAGFEQVIPIAHSHGLKVAFSAWLGKDQAANDKEISCLVKAAIQYEPDLLILGSETVYREDISTSQLIEYLHTVKKILPDFKVATADTSASWLKNKELIQASDVVLANIYPYWEGKNVADSISWLNTTYTQLQKSAGEKEVWISESGWPDSGNTIKKAVPSSENSAAFFLNFVSWAKAKNVNYFYFEAFDEPWKETEKNPQEAHWGIWTSDYKLKEGMQQIFDGNSVEDNWTLTETPVPTRAPVSRSTAAATIPPSESAAQGPAAIYITLPAGSNWPVNGVVQGIVKNADPNKYHVAVYIQVGGGWWTKPLFDIPLTKISPSGSWSTPYITGGNDIDATDIVAVLLPNEAGVQLAQGGGLPDISNYVSARISR
jgi:exo-beta-1,3-glucanase (GH17 family)